MPRVLHSARRQVAADTEVRFLLGRLRAAEKAEAQAAQRAREIGDLGPGQTPEYAAADEARRAAWLNAEDARHRLDQRLHPRRYAARGFRDEALDKYRAIADAQAGYEDREPPAELTPCEMFGPGFAGVTWEDYDRHFEVDPETEADQEAEAEAERCWNEARIGLREPAPLEAGADRPRLSDGQEQGVRSQAEQELEAG
jgi:hypothetical protein